jgi:hypothetical protein
MVYGRAVEEDVGYSSLGGLLPRKERCFACHVINDGSISASAVVLVG